MSLPANIYSLVTRRQCARELPARKCLLVLVSVLVLLLSACTTPSLEQRSRSADAIARSGQLQGRVINSSQFNFKIYQRRASAPQPELVIYIEGDGLAWASRRRVSDNPTPVSPVALRLAARDPSPALAYIARPCQYLPLASESNCSPRVWTHARYSSDVVQAFMEVVNQLKVESGSQRIGLVGFSGGGTIAALLAAKRRDVAWLVTVAGNLNPDLWAGLHGVSPLTDSLNPIDEANALENIPQLHLIGSADAVMPAAIAQSYRKAMRRPDKIRIVNISGQDHGCCWQQSWPQLLCENFSRTIPSCANSR